MNDGCLFFCMQNADKFPSNRRDQVPNSSLTGPQGSNPPPPRKEGGHGVRVKAKDRKIGDRVSVFYPPLIMHAARLARLQTSAV